MIVGEEKSYTLEKGQYLLSLGYLRNVFYLTQLFYNTFKKILIVDIYTIDILSDLLLKHLFRVVFRFLKFRKLTE